LRELNSIPIENIYYMPCYAWDKLDYLDRNKVGVLEERDVLNLISRIFVKEVEFLLKKGLYREYNAFEEDTSILRGKINFNESLSLMVNKKNKLMCSFEELDYNITLNKIVKTTVINLLKVKSLKEENRKQLKKVLSYFSTIDTIYLDERVFKDIRYNPSNKAYGFIINLCKLIKDN